MRHEDVKSCSSVIPRRSMRASGVAPPIRSLSSREAGGQLDATAALPIALDSSLAIEYDGACVRALY